MPTTQPMMSIASSGRFCPTSFTTISASFSAAPVFSSTVPIIVPKIITIPILLNVPLKPTPIIAGILDRSMPATIARTKEMLISAKNGCTFSLEIITIISMMATTKQTISEIPLIKTPLF